MKKLLSLLGATVLTFSGVASVTACTKTSEAVQAALGNSKINLALASNSFARAMIVGNEKGYDANYIINNFTKGDIVNAPVDESEGVNKYSYLGDISSLYFNENLYSKDFTTDLQLEGKKPEFASDNILGQLGSIIPILIKLIEEKGLFGALQIFLNMPLLWEFISPNLIKMLGNIVDQDTLLTFKDAFDDSIYEGFTYQEVLNSGIISLSNSIDAFLNPSENRTTINYRLSSSDELDNHYQEALKIIEKNVTNLIENKATFNLDLIDSLPFIAELLRFVRTLFVYIEQFDQYRQYKPNILEYNEYLFSPTKDNSTIINEVRQKNYNTETNINFQKLIVNIQYYFTTSDDDPNGFHLMKLFQILFLSEDKSDYNGYWNLVTTLIQSLVNTLDLNFFEEAFFKAGLTKLVKSFVINDDGASQLFTLVMSQVNDPDQKKQLKEMADRSTKGFDALYKGQLIKDLLDVFEIFSPNSVEKKSKNEFPINNLRELLTIPLKEILSDNLITNILGDNSITDFLNKLAKDAGIIDKYAQIDSTNDFSTVYLAKTFDKLSQPTVWTDENGKEHKGTLLQQAVSNPEKLLEVLGYKSDGTFAVDSVAWYLNEIFEKSSFLLPILADVLKNLQASANKQNEVAQKLFNDIKNSWLTALKTEITVMKQDFTYNGNEIVQLTETIKYNDIEYNVVVKKVNGYFVFNTISKL
ncbi:MOLPALP family lipoprotein [Spiroplasma chrysopicola]|uniref:MOLPALP family lipoprotein n=1 Tax=Spiroplasma chrysopicola DF-1 TaxID=1276227 RepID=R4U4R4_9MOLU|nr:MOLPALP family lipoprotein [Spiroplasma chrysopicola]AGM25553.1 hypothetical protein SCHRY_v1c09810 [Spiroplasma chrysopicola DF-1]